LCKIFPMMSKITQELDKVMWHRTWYFGVYCDVLLSIKVWHLVIFDPKQRLLYFNTCRSFWLKLLYLPCIRLLCNFFWGGSIRGVWANCLATGYLKVFNFDRFNMRLSKLWHKVCLWVPWNIFEVYIYV
jgi:hypothetical protein